MVIVPLVNIVYVPHVLWLHNNYTDIWIVLAINYLGISQSKHGGELSSVRFSDVFLNLEPFL